ncbi:TOBE domain-containing protein [Shewanella avicenniae]|uniref:TOBE domain-containing protein n=2 Tax=Shewanella avicenniae TaxID=2814294 RepID=A0ABX7QWP6_9GAMM|nr:TOBE domain-containing protein [Shewanella avicenniae]
MDLKALLTLNNDSTLFANPRRIKLLQQVQRTGSISQGAKEAGISYKAAWDAINDMNQLAEQDVVHSAKGGKGGGGAKLTPFGERLLQLYSLMDQMQDMALTALVDAAVPMGSLQELMAHFSLETSARNQLLAEVVALQSDNVSDSIQLKLAGNQQVEASITHSSTARLALTIGKKVLLLFKAPSVSIQLHSDDSGNNQLRGVVTQLMRGNSRTEVTLDIGSDEQVYASVENELISAMKLTEGDYCYACFHPSNAIIASMK